MLTSAYDITSGMMQLHEQQALIATNLAGSNVPGYKGRYLNPSTFASELADADQRIAMDAEAPVTQPGAATSFAQGPLRPSGRALDMALNGEGFFQVETEQGRLMLTRNGRFAVSPDGKLTTQEGHTVMGSGGPIRFSPTDALDRVSVNQNGELQVDDAEGSVRALGQLKLVAVDDPQDLPRYSANFYGMPDGVAMREPTGTQIVHGHLEGANVSPVQEMASMIETVREFEMGQKLLGMLAELSRAEQQKLQL
jgi:flagellar basal body rod protein FlgG